MNAFLRIGMFIKRRPVKKPEPVGVLCEMRRYPVQYNAYAAAVACVNKRLQPVRVAAITMINSVGIRYKLNHFGG